MKTRFLIILGIIIVVSTALLTLMPQESEPESGNYSYEITGKPGGAGPHTKTELLFTRTDADTSYKSTVELTKDLHYTDLVLFWDWRIYSLDNHVVVTWMTSEQSWSDLFVATSDDYGKTFDVKNISQSRYYDHIYKSQIISDIIYLAWLEEFHTPDNVMINHIYFAKSDDLGTSFSKPISLDSPDGYPTLFDLTANDKMALVVWNEDVDATPDEKYPKNIFFAQLSDTLQDPVTYSGLSASQFDFELDGETLYGAWSSIEDDDQIFYGISRDYGKTFDVSEIFNANWETSPYAQPPIPNISIGDKVTAEWTMRNEEGVESPYISVLEKYDESKTCPDGQDYNEVLVKCVVSCDDDLVYNGYTDSCTTEFELKYHGFCNEGFVYDVNSHTCNSGDSQQDSLKDPPRTAPPEPEPTPDMGLHVDVTGQKQVRRGTTHDITVDVTRAGNPIYDAFVRITIEDYGKDVIREFEGKTDSSGKFVFSWEIPKSFDDIETLLAYVDVTDNISAKTVLFKFQVYCLPNEQGCKVEGH